MRMQEQRNMALVSHPRTRCINKRGPVMSGLSPTRPKAATREQDSEPRAPWGAVT
jgi:hypothetical protein